MKSEIAVLVDEKMRTSAFWESGTVIIYAKEEGTWVVRKSIAYDSSQITSLASTRLLFNELLKKLEECRIIICREISGVPYNFLDTAGFNIWEIEGSAAEFLDYVSDKEEALKAAEVSEDLTAEALIYPKKVENGCYTINLKELQQKNSDVTSKQALLPFLSKEKFYELEVICAHIPPWFEPEFKKLKLKSVSKKLNENEYLVTVSHMTCE